MNKVTEILFRVSPRVQDMNELTLSQVEKYIQSTGFYKNKAKNIKETCRIILDKHKGEVPQTLDELIQLKGVGRKTANVVLGNAFEISSGVVVDTHVMRLSQRLGWVQSKDPVKIERVLMELVPKEDWILLSHLLIQHGRTVCKARSPLCTKCFLSNDCPKVGVKLS